MKITLYILVGFLNLTVQSALESASALIPISVQNAIQATATTVGALEENPQAQTTQSGRSIAQVMPVSQLSDVQPQDWAFQALQSLVERYGVIAGYSDSTFRGRQTLTRYEFAAGLNAVLERISELIATGASESISSKDLEILQRLQQEFAVELTTLQSRVDSLEARTAGVEANQFSTTTRLSGQVIFALNGGGFEGNRIIAPRGALIAQDDPNPTFLYRTTFNLNTSFQGDDLLQVRIVTGSDRTEDNVTGVLEPSLGSVLDFTQQGVDDTFSVSRAYYRFSPTPDLEVTIGSRFSAFDIIDKNSFANNSSLDFSTQMFINNFFLVPRPLGAGAGVVWNPSQGALTLRAVYVATSAEENFPENNRLFGGGRPEDVRLFPTGGGGSRGSLFGDPRQGIVELEYAPSKAFAMRLQYGGGEVFGSNFDVLAANFNLALSDQFGIFGRYGYGSYPDTTLGDIHPNYWMAGISLQDLFVPGALTGIAVGQPFIDNAVGNATQTNIELFYNLPINHNIRVTPLLQIVIDPGNQDSNGTIVTGTLRTVFNF
ncbi:MAG: hypothetical protein N4J56_006642 [Chroococcidiopsis sp. SAG 2025]|uniref:iron uptake porin n=1 Tax=Chroococcidiopsis sp. SAG 2025 TaxID=171389 RepID=UPI0029370B41|nr:iron uptake porin [Chroococcidiopsis sp. SAG 2025]MDV2996937.1 hypothetical protein [Chroococcidiopsis sp. SAG 2025]